LQRPARKRAGKAAKRGISAEQVCILVAVTALAAPSISSQVAGRSLWRN